MTAAWHMIYFTYQMGPDILHSKAKGRAKISLVI